MSLCKELGIAQAGPSVVYKHRQSSVRREGREMSLDYQAARACVCVCVREREVGWYLRQIDHPDRSPF